MSQSSLPLCLCEVRACAEIMAAPHIVGVSFQWADHGDEERLLKQGHHSADHGLQTSQGAKVVRWVAVGDTGWLLRVPANASQLVIHQHSTYTDCTVK